MGLGGIHGEAPRTAANGVSWHHWGHTGWTPAPRLTQCHSLQANVQTTWLVNCPRTHLHRFLQGNPLDWGRVGAHQKPVACHPFWQITSSMPQSPQGGVGMLTEDMSSPGYQVSTSPHPIHSLELSRTPSHSHLPGFGVSWTSREGLHGMGRCLEGSICWDSRQGPGRVKPQI